MKKYLFFGSLYEIKVMKKFKNIMIKIIIKYLVLFIFNYLFILFLNNISIHKYVI